MTAQPDASCCVWVVTLAQRANPTNMHNSRPGPTRLCIEQYRDYHRVLQSLQANQVLTFAKHSISIIFLLTGGRSVGGDGNALLVGLLLCQHGSTCHPNRLCQHAPTCHLNRSCQHGPTPCCAFGLQPWPSGPTHPTCTTPALTQPI